MSLEPGSWSKSRFITYCRMAWFYTVRRPRLKIKKTGWIHDEIGQMEAKVTLRKDGHLIIQWLIPSGDFEGHWRDIELNSKFEVAGGGMSMNPRSKD